MIFDISEVENIIGYEFNDKNLLRTCFTHSSYANEHGAVDNELLEFFGDSILEFIVTEHLFKNARGDEGDMTKLRAEMVSKTPLLKVVKKMGLDKFLLLGNGQVKTKNSTDKMYSSIYEALVAGIYLDGGIKAVKKFIEDTLIKEFKPSKTNKQLSSSGKDFKSELQEHVQKTKIGSIGYETLYKKGPDHKPEFKIAVLFNGTKIAEAKGSSKKEAEMAGAKKALQRLKKQGGKQK